MNNDIYPLTVIRDRYTGTYSDGKFTAWNLQPWQLPEGIADDDVTCMNTWWKEIPHIKIPIGLGVTIEEAVTDLETKIEEASQNEKLNEMLWQVSHSDMKWDDICFYMCGGKQSETDNA